jgi:hypothetical protein
MCTVTVLKVAHCQGCLGSGDSAGASSEANRLARLPSSLQECAVVERRHQRGDGRIGGVHVGQHGVAQPCQHPAGDDLNARFCGGLVLGQKWACRENRDAVVPGEVAHRLVELGVVAASHADQRTRVVGHDKLRAAAVEGQRPRHRAQPRAHALVGGGAGEGVARRAHGGDEDLGARAVGQFQRGAGVVDEQLLAGAPLLAHRALQGLGEGLVVLAELGVGPGAPALEGGAVFLPQQHQRHALAAQFDVHAGEVGQGDAGLDLAASEQPALERGLVEFGRCLPVQPGGTGQAELLGDHALGAAQAARDGLVRERAVVLESEDVLDHAYVHSWLGHWLSGKSR